MGSSQPGLSLVGVHAHQIMVESVALRPTSVWLTCHDEPIAEGAVAAFDFDRSEHWVVPHRCGWGFSGGGSGLGRWSWGRWGGCHRLVSVLHGAVWDIVRRRAHDGRRGDVGLRVHPDVVWVVLGWRYIFRADVHVLSEGHRDVMGFGLFGGAVWVVYLHVWFLYEGLRYPRYVNFVLLCVRRVRVPTCVITESFNVAFTKSSTAAWVASCPPLALAIGGEVAISKVKAADRALVGWVVSSGPVGMVFPRGSVISAGGLSFSSATCLDLVNLGIFPRLGCFLRFTVVHCAESGDSIWVGPVVEGAYGSMGPSDCRTFLVREGVGWSSGWFLGVRFLELGDGVRWCSRSGRG